MASTTRGSIKISTANGIGAALVDVMGGVGYKPDEWEQNINLCGIHAADIESALENIEEDAGTGTERGSILFSTANAIGATLNKKFNTSRGFSPREWASAASKLEPLPERTASGAIAHIEDGADGVPLKNWLVTLPASLDGYSEVNGTKSGKNLFDGYTKGYGVNSSTGAIFANNNGAISGYIPIKPNTAFYVSGLTDTIHSFVAYYKKDKTYISRTNGSNRTYVSATTPSECFYVIVYQYANNDVGTIDDIDNLQTQLEVGSTATAYEAYTAPTTYTASLGRTIYGGTADVVTGEGTDSYDKGSMSSTYLSGLNSDYIGYESSTAYFGGHPSVWVRNWNYSRAKARQTGGIGCVCNYFPVSMHNTTIFASQYRIYFDVNGKNISSVADFIAFVQNLEANNESLDIVYELNDTYTTDFTFTPITPTPETALGVNNFWSDEGDSEITYRKDLDIPDPVPGNLLGMNNGNNEEESEG